MHERWRPHNVIRIPSVPTEGRKLKYIQRFNCEDGRMERGIERLRLSKISRGSKNQKQLMKKWVSERILF
jgi:uncharacterized protein YbcI